MARSRTLFALVPPTGLYVREDRCQTPLEKFRTIAPRPPIDLMYAVAAFESEGWRCTLVDCPAEGIDATALERRLRAERPEAVLLSCTTQTVEDDLATAALAKRLDPGMVIAESNLATARARLGDYQDAVAHYERALAREPSNAVAHEGLADSLALLGRLDEAIVHYREALRWAPDTVSARRSLARTLRRAGREAEAEEEERVANVMP